MKLPLRSFSLKHVFLFTLFYFIILIRFYSIDYPLAEGGGETSRDYLVATHILNYQEFLMTGP